MPWEQVGHNVTSLATLIRGGAIGAGFSSVFSATAKRETLGAQMTGNSTSYYQNTPTQTKVYVDGFRIDTIQTPKLSDDLREVALTFKVKRLLEDRVIASIVPVPNVNPRFILITTEI